MQGSFGLVELRQIHVAHRADALRYILRKCGPLRRADRAKCQLQEHPRVVAQCKIEAARKGSVAGQVRLHLGDFLRRGRRRLGRGGQTRIARTRHEEGLPPAQEGEQHSVRSHLGRSVEPGGRVPRWHISDHVVELAGRGHGGVEFDSGADQRRPCLDTGGRKQRRQQGVFVLAVAVLVGQHLAGGVRLIPSAAEGYRDVVELGGDELVYGAQLAGIGGDTIGKFGGFGSDLRSQSHFRLLQCGVPPANVLPTLEGAELN